MGMDVGTHGGPKSEINVTPFVDVVLVLRQIGLLRPQARRPSHWRTPNIPHLQDF